MNDKQLILVPHIQLQEEQGVIVHYSRLILQHTVRQVSPKGDLADPRISHRP